ncbi:hypothetical protein O9992_27445 [Vibrio lentus]|nr:hypothetical protein [Vibrio lentus]
MSQAAAVPVISKCHIKARRYFMVVVLLKYFIKYAANDITEVFRIDKTKQRICCAIKEYANFDGQSL